MEVKVKKLSLLETINNQVYSKNDLIITDLIKETEGNEYDACLFTLNGFKIINRTAKITPKKVGQFVTFWKRNIEGITEPFSINDNFDFYIINIQAEDRVGQFIIPKGVLAEKGIITTEKKEGKRGFRVYAPWDITTSKQAQKTRQWQGDYFYAIGELNNLKRFLN